MHDGTEATTMGDDVSGKSYGICRIGDAYVGLPVEALSEVCQFVKLSKILRSAIYMSGVINLRGQLIPIINLPLICGLAEPDQPAGFAVVLRYADQMLGFLVNHVMGIIHVGCDKVQVLTSGADTEGQVCVRSVFLDSDRTISIVDVDSIFSLPGVFSVKSSQINRTNAVEEERISMLTFVVGGARFSVNARDVYGTVPCQIIEVGAMTSGYCLGSITYHQRRVPVLNTVDVLGIGRREKWTASEVVVLRCQDDLLLGLAVDAIQDIERTDLGKYTQVPGVVARRHNFLSHVVIRDDGTQVFILSARALLQDPGVAAMAGLSFSPLLDDGQEAGPDAAANQIHLIDGRYLVIQAGRTFAVPFDQVTSIVAMPETIMPVSSPEIGLQGYFSWQSNSVPLVDLGEYLQLPSGSTEMARVLLTGEREHQVGFRVERVFSIEASNWSLKGFRKAGPGSETLVQFGDGDSKRTMPVLDLAEIALKKFGSRPLVVPSRLIT